MTAPLSVPATCGSVCPEHGHPCLRSPSHLSNCRDAKQKGRQSCDWAPGVDLSAFRRPVRDLARQVRLRGGLDAPCWVIRTHTNCALIVPIPGGGLAYQRTFKRGTVDEAAAMRLIRVGAEMVTVPPFEGSPNWLVDLGATMGRTATVGRGVPR